MLIHVALDAYAFVGTHMFETNPATQRVAERTGLDSLSDAVFVLDTEQKVVQMNNRAERRFLEPVSASLPAALEDIFGVTLETLRETGEITIDTESGRRTFAVSYTGLTDPVGESVACMIVLYDVTEERQRGQQLTVLNRVLRHNLRNETTVISGHAEVLQAAVEDPEHAEQAGTIGAASDRLNAIAEKVRSFEELQQRVIQPEALSPQDVLADVVEPYSQTHSEDTITWTVEPPDLRLRTDPVVLSGLLENLVANAVMHSDSGDPRVRITVSASRGTNTDARIEIRDNNERIPEHEIETLRAGDETPLQHSRGIGLWISHWCAQRLNGDVDFQYDDGNVVSVTI
jgi:signal transduction histidine kinase